MDFERDVDGKMTIGPTLNVPIPIFDSNQAQIAKAGIARGDSPGHPMKAILQKESARRTAYIGRDRGRHRRGRVPAQHAGRARTSQRLPLQRAERRGAFQAGEIHSSTGWMCCASATVGDTERSTTCDSTRAGPY